MNRGPHTPHRSMVPLSASARVTLAAVALAVATGATAAAAPEARLWPRWEAHDPASRTVVDHGPFERFLAAYLETRHPSGINRVAYRRVTATDRAGLEAYVAALQAVRVSSLSRPEQMAFWINLYNAFTIKLILDNYPVATILRISPGSLLPRGPWDARLLDVEGESLSLNDIEHRILRPLWKDPRIHYAVNCASIGCPNLQERPYTATNLEELLDKAARDYINHPRGVSFEGNQLRLSSIYSWYAVDFGKELPQVIAHLARYADPTTAQRLRDHKGRVKYEYDWNLNE